MHSLISILGLDEEGCVVGLVVGKGVGSFEGCGVEPPSDLEGFGVVLAVGLGVGVCDGFLDVVGKAVGNDDGCTDELGCDVGMNDLEGLKLECGDG